MGTRVAASARTPDPRRSEVVPVATCSPGGWQVSEVIRSPSVVALFQARRDLRCNPGDLQGFLRPCIYPTNPSDQPARKKSAPKGVESAETPTRGKMSFMNDESDDEELCAISLRTRSKSKLATPKPGAVGNVGNIFEVRAEAVEAPLPGRISGAAGAAPRRAWRGPEGT